MLMQCTRFSIATKLRQVSSDFERTGSKREIYSSKSHRVTALSSRGKKFGEFSFKTRVWHKLTYTGLLLNF